MIFTIIFLVIVSIQVILRLFFKFMISNIFLKQVCIPVGCVPPTCCPYLPACTVQVERECLLPGGVCSGGLLLGDVCSQGVSARGCLLQGVSAPEGCLLPRWVCVPACTEADTPLWTEWLTDSCKNIAFANFSISLGSPYWYVWFYTIFKYHRFSCTN